MSHQQYQKGKRKKTSDKSNQFHTEKAYYIQEVAIEPEQSALSNDKYLFFPGELYEYSEGLMRTDLFEIINSLQTTKRPAVLTIDCHKNQTLNVIGRYYSPKVNDLVIGVIEGKLSDAYKVDIGTYCNALLNKKEIDGNKNAKNEYEIGDLVLSKVISINKNDSPQLTCLNEKKKAVVNYWEMPLGRLSNGTIYSIALSDVALLSKSNDTIKKIKQQKDFICTICVGSNGRIWINCTQLDKIHKIYKVISLSLKQKIEDIEIDSLLI